MIHIFGFVEYYIAPFFFAVGLVMLLYGIINYYIIGPGFEEERREIGRQSLLWATFLFLIGLGLFLIAHWLFILSEKVNERVEVDTERRVDILPVPDVPGVR